MSDKHSCLSPHLGSWWHPGNLRALGKNMYSPTRSPVDAGGCLLLLRHLSCKDDATPKTSVWLLCFMEDMQSSQKEVFGAVSGTFLGPNWLPTTSGNHLPIDQGIAIFPY